MENPKTYKALIVDDEQPARTIVANYLKNIIDIEVVGECENGFEALKMIHEIKPDILFLDIQMPKLTGLELLEVMEERPNIIFTTAYDQFALKAFELNAVDYLLKPFSEQRFRSAVEKVKERIKQGQPANTTTSVINSQSTEVLSRVVVKNGTAISVIPVNDIHFIEAQEDYVYIYTEQGRFIKNQTMNYYEQNLPINAFIRIHRSCIANIEKIIRIEPYDKDTYMAIVAPNHKLRISRTGYKKLKESLRF